MAKMADFDSSGFQNIVLMLIGVLVIMLVSNVLTIISNPDNIKIGAIVSGTIYEDKKDENEQFVPPKFQNMRQDPIYIDVEADRLTIYPERKTIEARDLAFEGNDFERFLGDVEKVKSARYIVLLLRPGSAVFQRQLRQVIRDRGIDVGFEPWDTGREIEVAGQAPSPLSTGTSAAPAGAEAVPAAGEAAPAEAAAPAGTEAAPAPAEPAAEAGGA